MPGGAWGNWPGGPPIGGPPCGGGAWLKFCWPSEEAVIAPTSPQACWKFFGMGFA